MGFYKMDYTELQMNDIFQNTSEEKKGLHWY